MPRLPHIELSTVLELGGIAAVTIALGVIWWPMALIVAGATAIFVAQGVNRS